MFLETKIVLIKEIVRNFWGYGDICSTLTSFYVQFILYKFPRKTMTVMNLSTNGL